MLPCYPKWHGTLQKRYTNCIKISTYSYTGRHYVNYFRTLQATNKINGATKGEECRKVQHAEFCGLK